jgi:membrane protein DedA with SNARE-associated domain
VDEIVGGWPYWATYAFFVVVALLRSNATYWVGRGLRAGGERSRLSERLERPLMRRAERLVGRYGPVAVALCFLTIGVQTAVNLTAGALRMPLRRFVPATVVGSLLWAALYTTAGFAVLRAWTGEVSPWWALLVVAVVVAIVAGASRLTRRDAPQASESAGPTTP